MSESELKLVGWINPLVDVYPTPLTAVVETSKKEEFLVYPDGSRNPLGLLDRSRVFVRWLAPEFQMPYRAEGRDDLLYGVAPGYTLIGDLPSVTRNLRLVLSTLDPKSSDHRLITQFIEGDRQPTH